MFHLGFEPQVSSIVGQLRPDRQSKFSPFVAVVTVVVLCCCVTRASSRSLTSSHTHSHTHTLTLFVSLSLYPCLNHTHAHTHSHTHSLTHPVTPFLGFATIAVLFSATFQKKVEVLARSTLTNPIRVSVGVSGGSSADVNQVIHVLRLEEKWAWLTQHLPAMERAGSVLIFVSTKAAADELSANLNRCQFLSTWATVCVFARVFVCVSTCMCHIALIHNCLYHVCMCVCVCVCACVHVCMSTHIYAA
jgi:hypothetical protein